MVLESVEFKIEGTAGRRDCVWIIPFQIRRDSIPDVNGGEVWIVAFVEGSPVAIELV
jgi:hypothetical protein